MLVIILNKQYHILKVQFSFNWQAFRWHDVSTLMVQFNATNATEKLKNKIIDWIAQSTYITSVPTVMGNRYGKMHLNCILALKN